MCLSGCVESIVHSFGPFHQVVRLLILRIKLGWVWKLVPKSFFRIFESLKRLHLRLITNLRWISIWLIVVRQELSNSIFYKGGSPMHLNILFLFAWLGISWSTISSKSAFSTGGHVLDHFQNSLTSEIIEASFVHKIGKGKTLSLIVVS